MGPTSAFAISQDVILDLSSLHFPVSLRFFACLSIGRDATMRDHTEATAERSHFRYSHRERERESVCTKARCSSSCVDGWMLIIGQHKLEKQRRREKREWVRFSKQFPTECSLVNLLLPTMPSYLETHGATAMMSTWMGDRRVCLCGAIACAETSRRQDRVIVSQHCCRQSGCPPPLTKRSFGVCTNRTPAILVNDIRMQKVDTFKHSERASSRSKAVLLQVSRAL